MYGYYSDELISLLFRTLLCGVMFVITNGACWIKAFFTHWTPVGQHTSGDFFGTDKQLDQTLVTFCII